MPPLSLCVGTVVICTEWREEYVMEHKLLVDVSTVWILLPLHSIWKWLIHIILICEVLFNWGFSMSTKWSLWIDIMDRLSILLHPLATLDKHNKFARIKMVDDWAKGMLSYICICMYIICMCECVCVYMAEWFQSCIKKPLKAPWFCSFRWHMDQKDHALQCPTPTPNIFTGLRKQYTGALPLSSCHYCMLSVQQMQCVWERSADLIYSTAIYIHYAVFPV